MKFLKIALATAAIAGFASTASAQDNGAYINVGIDTYQFDVYNLGGKLGYNIGNNFAIEGQGSFGVSSKNGEKVDYSAGVFGVLKTPLGDQVEAFVRGGYYFAQLSNRQGFDANFNGFAAGGGLQYFFSENDGIRVEYTYLDGDVGSADTASISYVRNF